MVRPAARGRLRSSAGILPADRQERLLRPPRGNPRPPLRSLQHFDSRLDNFVLSDGLAIGRLGEELEPARGVGCSSCGGLRRRSCPSAGRMPADDRSGPRAAGRTIVRRALGRVPGFPAGRELPFDRRRKGRVPRKRSAPPRKRAPGRASIQGWGRDSSPESERLADYRPRTPKAGAWSTRGPRITRRARSGARAGPRPARARAGARLFEGGPAPPSCPWRPAPRAAASTPAPAPRRTPSRC